MKARSSHTAQRLRALSQAKPGAFSQTVSRALSILKMFDRERRELGITEIGEELALPKTIVFRLVQTLKEFDFLERNPGNSKYRIGLGAFEVGNLFKSSTLETEAGPIMRQLVDETGHTAQLAVLHRDEMVIIARMEGRGPLKYGVSVGERRPLHSSAVGKAGLSMLSEDQIDTMFGNGGLKRMTPNSIVDLRRLKADLAQVRARGYSINWEENTVGVASVAAPVSSRHSHAITAIALAFPAQASIKKELPKIGKVINAAAQALAARI